MEHLAEQSVLDFAMGAMIEPAASAAHAHLDRCGDCRALVAQVIRGTAPSPAAPTLAGHDVAPTLAEAPAARRHAVPPAPIGQLDEYRVVELLGHGGMGTVYRAHDTLLDREVALKLIARTDSEQARQRFLLEARAVARIRHPNVVTVHRVGIASLAGAQPYIVYDLVRGHTLGELRRPSPWPRVLELGTGIARGLAAAHACGVLHRDLKPANLMIDERDEVVLVDFGLAKLDGIDLFETPHAVGSKTVTEAPATVTGVALGTPRYMAPESWRGMPATQQTDLYSLGLVLYELIAGRLPFADAPMTELARRVCDEDPPPLREVAPWVPRGFASIIDRCIARDPAQRPASAAAFGIELEDLQRGRAFEDFERDRVRRAPPGNPYPGARPFGFEHQGVFFGRGAELRALVDQLRERPFVVVAGDAGTGKTSLCKAGLLPIISRGALGGARKWVPVLVTPGVQPLRELAIAMAGHLEDDLGRLDVDEVERRLRHDPDPVIAGFRAGHRGGCTAHVLFVDQLEQLVTADPADARLAAAIIGKLAEPAPSLRVLATVRADSLVSVARLPGLAAVLGTSLYLLSEPHAEAAWREIIVEPARLSGRAVDEPLVGSLVESATRGELKLGELGSRLAGLWERLPVAVS
jgi:hypothetical protein